MTTIKIICEMSYTVEWAREEKAVNTNMDSWDSDKPHLGRS